MGQAKIKKKNRQKAENGKRKAELLTQPVARETIGKTSDGPINLAQITSEMMGDPLFQSRYKEMLDGLSKPKKQSEICVHEAAHAVYFEQARAKNIKFNKPEIFHDGKSDYVGYGASVSYDVDPAALKGLTTGQWAFEMVKAHLVGGIAAEVLEGATILGDETDFKNFSEFYDEAKLESIYVDMTLVKLHDDAVRIIRLELAGQSIESLIRAKAVEAKAVLFDPYF